MSKAKLELDEFLLAWQKHHKLTRAEYLMALADHIATNLQWAVRSERGQDDD